MATWTNHVALAAPRNGGTTHTVDPAAGTVVAGANFTPAAGRLLVACATGAVTSTTPAGWTLPSGGSAINNVGLYVWYRTAAGSDTFSTTHNGSDYPVGFDIYEFAAGSTFVQAAASTGVADAGTGPALSGLTGTNHLTAISGQGATSTLSSGSISWGTGVEVVDTLTVRGGAGPTDGYLYSAAYVQDSSSATFSSAATFVSQTNISTTAERIVFAVNITGGASDPVIMMRPLIVVP